MQILFLTDKNYNDTMNKEILQYEKSLNRNILYVEISDIYDKDGFIYSKNAIVINGNKLVKDILLSPSIVINLASLDVQEKIDLYLKKFWINTHQAFFELDYNKLTDNSSNLFKLIKENSSFCFAYIENLSKPEFKVFEESITLDNNIYANCELKYLKSLIEFNITEYWTGYLFDSIQKYHNELFNNKSSLYLVKFDIETISGDFDINVTRLSQMNFVNFINNSKKQTFNYFDSILNARINTFIAKMYFRDKILQESIKNNVEFEPSCKNMFLLMKENYSGFQKAYFGGVNTEAGLLLADDKHKTNQHLEKLGYSVNKSQEYLLENLNEPQKIEKLNLKYPVVAKPADKQGGYGVFTNIPDNNRFFSAMQTMINMKDITKVIVEEFFTGTTYRFLVIGNETRAVLKFDFPNIVGNGKNSIDDLIKSKNIMAKSKIKITDEIKLNLESNNYNLQSVLPDGKKLVLSYDSHPSLGGGAIDVTNAVDVTYKDLATKVSKSMQLEIAGIDIMINKKGDYKIIEVNTAPALSTHLEPQYGNSINVYYYVMKTMLMKTKIEGNNSFFPNLVYYHR